MSFDESKRELKKSLARMMVYWVVHTRHDLREELLANNPNATWAGLSLREVFDGEEEWKAFFERASNLFHEEVDVPGKGKIKVVEAGAKRINDRADGRDGYAADWDPLIVPDCPSNLIINVMFRAAVDLVDKQ